MSRNNLSYIISYSLSDKNTCYERVPSTRDRSVRELKYGPHHIHHRFPIKDGITATDILALNISQHNSFLERLRSKNLVK